MLLWCLREHGALESILASSLRRAKSLKDVAGVLSLEGDYAASERGEPYPLLQRYNTDFFFGKGTVAHGNAEGGDKQSRDHIGTVTGAGLNSRHERVDAAIDGRGNGDRKGKERSHDRSAEFEFTDRLRRLARTQKRLVEFN